MTTKPKTRTGPTGRHENGRAKESAPNPERRPTRPPRRPDTTKQVNQRMTTELGTQADPITPTAGCRDGMEVGQ